MAYLFRSVIFVLIGLGIAKISGIHHLEGSHAFAVFAAGLLAVGLYASTFGIEIAEVRLNLKTIALAVTVGVFLKAALIALPLRLITGDSKWFVLGVVVAQIDPLSVAVMMENSRMSSRAKSIIAAWSSFDDPVTVLMTFYFLPIVLRTNGNSLTVNAVQNYWSQLGLNLVFALGAFIIWRLLRSLHPRRMVLCVVATSLVAGLLFGIAVWQFLMLGLAITGLFFRPNIGNQLNRAVQVALLLAFGALGMLLSRGIDVGGGLTLAIFAFASQMIVGSLLTRNMSRSDRLAIACAQQNGITAIILALLIEPDVHGAVGIVAPAILFINLFNLIANAAISSEGFWLRQIDNSQWLSELEYQDHSRSDKQTHEDNERTRKADCTSQTS